MKIEIFTYIDGDKEIRSFWQHGLVCSNPREYYKMTRSFEQMRAEYDLLHCHEITEEDILAALIKAKPLYSPFHIFSGFFNFL